MLTNNNPESQDDNLLESNLSIEEEKILESKQEIDSFYRNQDKSFWQKINPFQREKKIKTQLLGSILPTVLIPLVLVGTLGYRITHEKLEDEIERKVAEHVLLARHSTSNIFFNSLELASVLATNPLIINAANDASEQATQQRLNQQSIAEVEKKFASNKLLTVNQTLNNYLKNITQEYKIAEVFFTDANGYNVAYSNPTSDFVQRDEQWWQEGKANKVWFSGAVFDESTKVNSIEYARAIIEPSTGKFVGVIKFLIPFSSFEVLDTYVQNTDLAPTESIQIIDTQTGIILKSMGGKDVSSTNEVMGGQTVLGIAQDVVKLQQQSVNDQNLLIQEINNKYAISNLKVSPINGIHQTKDSEVEQRIAFFWEGKRYYLTTIPETQFVAISSIEETDIQSAGTELIWVFLAITIVLGLIATGVILYISKQFSTPLTQLANTAEKAMEGNLDVVAPIGGSLETVTLGNNFNSLITRVKLLLAEQQKSLQELEIAKQDAEILAQEQQKQKENIQNELLSLLYDVEGVSNGDLTVRAQMSEGEIGIVADFFNSIVESLRDLVTQVKVTTLKVNESLIQDEAEVAKLAQEATNQSQKTLQMLDFVEEMSKSIQEVAQNTQSAAVVAQKASTTAQTGGVTIDKTVDSIVKLRDTVGETAKKVKRLGESSQEISKVVSLINQIALQTNLLAINASIEAARAGEDGRGFAVVAEEIGQLAIQSASATKEIEQIVEAIQKETITVVEAMENDTAQVVESTNLVAEAKKGFGEITQVSQEINDLLQSISGATASQTKTSEMVANLMKEIAKISRLSSESSTQVANSLGETVNQARQLQTSVETFKVN